MASFRDRALTAFRDWTGMALVEGERLDRLQEGYGQLDALSADAEDLAFWVQQYWGGRQDEMLPYRRRRLTRRTRQAFLHDPTAGTEAEHYANFAIGRGVTKPLAKDPDVQKIIDRAWEDPTNLERLTGYDALRAISNELKTSSNIYLLLFRGGGRVRVTFLNADWVEEIVTDTENDRLRPLWYVAREPDVRWDMDSHQWVSQTPMGGTIEPTYYAHWRNVDDLVREAKDTPGVKKPVMPKPDLLGDGVVFHVRTNRLVEQQFGNPQWARTLRFFAALNRLLEARVSMAQAASSIIAKRVVKGGRDDVQRAAAAVMKRTGEIAAGAVRRDDALGLQRPLRPGAIRTENESDNLQAVNLQSGAAQAAQDIQMVRGAAISPSAMGQHYFGAADASNLSTAACHDEATETLTAEGWMTYAELRERDSAGTLPKIAGFNTETGRMEYHRPLQKMLQYDYDGEMVRFRNAKTDILVTPDHRMWVGRGDRWEFREAREIIAQGPRGGHQRFDQLKAVGPVRGNRQETFVLPAYEFRHGRFADLLPEDFRERVRAMYASHRILDDRPGYCQCGCGSRTGLVGRTYYDASLPAGERPVLVRKGEPSLRCPGHRTRYSLPQIASELDVPVSLVERALGKGRTANAIWKPPVVRPAIRIPMDAFLYWLGWFIAEGSGGGEVAQAENSAWLPNLRDACDALGVESRTFWKGDGSKPGGRMWHWSPRNPKQWQVWLDEHVGRGARNKRVPEFVFDLPADQQMLVLRGLMHGDGACGTDDTWERRGSSVFGSSSLRLADDVQRLALNCGFRATHKGVGGVSIVATEERSVHQGWRGHVSRLPQGERVRYRGRVYCFTLPTDTMVTRRNGHVSFNGNTLELPAMAAVNAHQEIVEGILRWFTDRAIEEAIRNGELGGNIEDVPGALPLAEADLADPLVREAVEGRVKKDLSYTFGMPYPGRRNLPEVVQAFTSMMTQLSPLGENTDLLKAMLRYVFANGFELENAGDLADAVAAKQQGLLDEQKRLQQEQQQAQMQQFFQAQGQLPPGTGPDAGDPSEGAPVYGENRQTAQPGPDGTMPAQEAFLPPDMVPGVQDLLRDVHDALSVGSAGPAVEAISRLNGHG